MKPEVQLWKPPEGAEILAVPKEMEQVRDQVIYMAANLMKLYGLQSVKVHVSMLGPVGVTSPTLEAFPAFDPVRPVQIVATEMTAVRAIVPLMLAYGIVGITIRLEDKDKTDMLNSWAKMKGVAQAPPPASGVVIEDEVHGGS